MNFTQAEDRFLGVRPNSALQVDFGGIREENLLMFAAFGCKTMRILLGSMSRLHSKFI